MSLTEFNLPALDHSGLFKIFVITLAKATSHDYRLAKKGSGSQTIGR